MICFTASSFNNQYAIHKQLFNSQGARTLKIVPVRMGRSKRMREKGEIGKVVWIDILTPKQGNLFSVLSKRLVKQGHKPILTTRLYREVNQLLEARRLRASIIGKHGGASIEEKLEASVEREGKLARFVGRSKPDLALSFSSPEAARVAFGLGVPHLCISDSPHAVAVSRLAIPLSERLFTPAVIPKKEWIGYGISADKIVQYDALDPIIWLRHLKPDRRILIEDGMRSKRRIVTVRLEESSAAYLLAKKRKKLLNTVEAIKELLRIKLEADIVALPRYDYQAQILREFKPAVVVPKTLVNGPNLLSFSSVFIGGGGTMTAEAAMLGIPSISCFPEKPTIIEEYLISSGLVVRETDPVRIAERAMKMLEDETYRRRIRDKAEGFVKRMEDPIEVILNELKRFS